MPAFAVSINAPAIFSLSDLLKTFFMARVDGRKLCSKHAEFFGLNINLFQMGILMSRANGLIKIAYRNYSFYEEPRPKLLIIILCNQQMELRNKNTPLKFQILTFVRLNCFSGAQKNSQT